MLPVAVALMTPIPLLIVFIIKKYFGKKEEIVENQDPATESMLKKNNEVDVIVASPISENKNEQA